MVYKSILTLLDNTEQCRGWTAYAIELAKAHNAQLIGIAPRELARSLYVGDFMAANSAWLSELQERIDADASEAQAAFTSLCQEKGLERYESHLIDGASIEVMRHQAMFCDLVVLGQYYSSSNTPGGVAGMVESLLLTTGRPVLVVPALGTHTPVATNVMIAWRETKESSIALRQSLPSLAVADTVELVEVTDKPNPTTQESGEKIIGYLALHGVAANYNQVVSGEDAGNMLLSHACDAGTELMVMGGYGHTRLKEWALGGVTKTILDTMTVPVLMAH
jgi:nucleotide-binding universal stress UspA family protein